MKTFKYLTMGAMLFLAASCAREEFTGTSVGEEVDVTLSVNVPGVETKAAYDDVTGAEMNLTVFVKYGDQIVLKETTTTDANGAKDISLRLVTGQTYQVGAWADFGNNGNYTINETTCTVSMKTTENVRGSIIADDAFFGFRDITLNSSNERVSLPLKRPFGLLTINTKDWYEPAVDLAGLHPTNYTMSLKAVPTSLDLFTGTVSNPQDVTVEGFIHSTTFSKDNTANELSFDYIFASEGEQALNDFSVTYKQGLKSITDYSFTNIPLRRNYKTNLTGNILTKEGTLNVDVVQGFETPDINRDLYVAKTVEEANEALADGKTHIVVEEALTAENNTIIIPKIYKEADAEISIALKDTGDKGITVEYDESTQNAPATVSISVSNAKTTEINLPESTVTLNGELYSSVTATTAENTLIIPDGVTVENLIIKGGNTEIYGTVSVPITFNNDNSIVKVFHVGTAEELEYAFQLVREGRCEKIVLKNDIDLKGSAVNKWIPVDTENTKDKPKVFKEFDGNNHTISNLFVDNFTGQENAKGYYYGGLFYVLQGNVRNLTIDGANVTCHRGGVLVGRMDYGTIENCHIKNVTVNSYQKAAGLVGYMNGGSPTADVVIRGCSVDKCQINTVAPEEGLFQAGGLIGYLQSFDRNVLIENNSVSNISFDKVYESAKDVVDKVWDMEQYYSHAFIGSVANVTNKADSYDEFKIELKGNSVDAQVAGIPTCDRTDNFIGWWAGDYNTGRPYSRKLIVDGVVKDRWIEVKRLAAQIEAGGDVIIHRNYDLSSLDRAIEITKPTNLTFDDGTIVINSENDKVQFLNNSEFTITAKENTSIKFKKRVVENLGKFTVAGGNYTTNTIGSGTLFWNNAAEAIMNINDVNVVASNFAVAGGGQINIKGGYIRSTSTNLNGSNTWAYCVRAQDGGNMTITDATIEGIQGAIACNGGSSIVINNATAIAKNTPGHTDAFYALYVAHNGTIEVNSGCFYSDRTPCCLASDEDQAGTPAGTFILKGGKYSSKPQTNIPREDDYQDWTPAEGYEYKEIDETIDGLTYKYEVVKK